MLKRDRWRLAIVFIVVLAALVSVFPIKGRINLGLDLKGGAHILLQAKGTEASPLTDDSIDRLLAVLRNRVDQYGVTEPVIQREGRDRIIVDLPGVEDPEAAMELLRTLVIFVVIFYFFIIRPQKKHPHQTTLTLQKNHLLISNQIFCLRHSNMDKTTLETLF